MQFRLCVLQIRRVSRKASKIKVLALRWQGENCTRPDLGVNRETTAARSRLHQLPKEGLRRRELLVPAAR